MFKRNRTTERINNQKTSLLDVYEKYANISKKKICTVTASDTYNFMWTEREFQGAT